QVEKPRITKLTADAPRQHERLEAVKQNEKNPGQAAQRQDDLHDKTITRECPNRQGNAQPGWQAPQREAEPPWRCVPRQSLGTRAQRPTQRATFWFPGSGLALPRGTGCARGSASCGY